MKYILLLFLFLVSHLSYCQNYDIRFNRSSINCSTRQVCYDVQLRPNGGSTFNLAGQNYRIFYNSATASYTNGTSLLPSQYGDFTLVQDVQGANADAVNGLLSFEATLGFLNYSMDLNDTQNGGIVLAAGQWTTTSNLCFNVTPEVINNPNSCIELVWGRQALTNPYATAFVEVSRWTGTNATTNSSGVLYDDLNSSDGDAACFNTACPSTVGENTITLCQDGIDNDGDGNTDCEDSDCLAIANLDCDKDGNPNGNDPNPTTPVAVNDAFTAPVGVSTNFNILSNDDFLPGANTSISRTGGNAGGTVAFNGSTGNISYTPLPSEAGSVVTVNYQVCNTVPNPDVCATATISITVPSVVNPSNDYNIRMVLKNVNCTTNQFCYTVQLSSANGNAMNLAGQNYRLYYDGSKMSYLSGISLLPGAQYTSYTLVQNIENQNAGAVNGPLTFEDHLSFLNYTMDLNDVVNGGITLPANGSWVSTSELCFQGSFSVTATPMTCIEAVWGRNGLTNAYATAFVEVAKWISANNTQMAMGVNYDDITLNDTQNVCQVTDCDQDGNPNGNDPNPTTPVAVNDAFTAPVGVATNFNILSNDDFLPGANTSISRTGGNAGGTVAFNGSTGNISYTPLPSEAGTVVTVNYQVCNTVPNPDVCATATISITVPTVVNPSNDYNIRMVLKNVNCTTNQFCYTVQLSSANGNAMNLAGQNYRLYYDGSKMSYLSGISLLPGAQYTSYTLVQNIENQNAGAVNGPLTFEDHLSFLNYTMDLNDVVNGGITLPANGSWVSTSELCFQGSFSVTATPMTCIEAVWGRNGLTNAYATAYVEVAKWISANNTQMAMGVNYDDITHNDTQNVCQVTDCDQDGNPNGNDPNPTTPVAVNDAFTAPVGVSTNFNILSNDDFLPGANTSISRTGGNAGGTVAFNGSTGNISYTPLPSEAGTVVTVNYQVCNTVPNPDVCATATISITVPTVVNPSNDYNIRMVLKNVNCTTNQFCYTVQLSSANGNAMNLAGQNYRLYYDGSKMSYLSGTSLLPGAQYTGFTLVQNIENQNAGAVNGPLTFEDHLSFLNYTMDLNDVVNGGITLPANGSWVSTSELCFQGSFSVTATPMTCIEAVWGRDGLTNAYATAFVEVAKWISANNTTQARALQYNDITLTSQENVCKSTLCSCDKPVLTVGDIVCNGNNYSVSFIHNGSSVSATSGSVSGNKLINIPLGTNVTITSSNGVACTTSSIVNGPSSCPTTCSFPDLTVGQAVCTGTTYSVSIAETTGATISVSTGTRVGNTVVNIPLGTQVIITATNGACVIQSVVTSPASCTEPCANPLISVGGTVCTSNNATYSVNYISVTGATVTASHGSVSNGVISGIPAGQAVTITASLAGCVNEVIVVAAPVCVCEEPLLTVGHINCYGQVYELSFITNGQISSNVGNVVANKIVNIPVGQNITITATGPKNCKTSVTIVSPTECEENCFYPDIMIGQGICTPSGLFEYSFVDNTGVNVTTSTGIIEGNKIKNVPPNTIFEVTATNGACTLNYLASSPERCENICEKPKISIGGTQCNENGTYSVYFAKVDGTTITSSLGILGNDRITGIPLGSSIVLTISFPGCSTNSITIQAPSCECVLPTLSINNIQCQGNVYEVAFFASKGSNVSSNFGTIVGNKITNIPIQQNIIISASTLTFCKTSIQINAPGTCAPNCTLPRISAGQAVCSGNGFYAVSFGWDGIGQLVPSAGIIQGNTIQQIPVNTNLVLEARNGLCVTSITVNKPVNCDVSCDNPLVSLATACNDAGTFDIFIAKGMGVTIRLNGVIINGNVIANQSGQSILNIRASKQGCADQEIAVEPIYCTPSECEVPILTVGSISCSNQFYSVVFFHNGLEILTSAGVVSGNSIVNIPVGTDVTITSRNSSACKTSTLVSAPTSCNLNCIQPNLTVGQAICNGLGTYSINFIETTGAVITRVPNIGVVVGQSITNIPLGQNIRIISTNGQCIASLLVNSPTNCEDPCFNQKISIGGTQCSTLNNTYTIFFSTGANVTVTSNIGVVSPGQISNIPSGQNAILTVSRAGCSIDIITVSAPNCNNTAAIGNFVWLDSNGNGVQNPGEPGIAGVKVNLYYRNGALIKTTNTDANGFYRFENLPSNQYYLEFITPSGFLNTFFNRSVESTDSDVDRSNGPGTTATITLTAGQQDMTWDAGYYKCAPIGDLVWYDTNKNDIWDTNENGINGLRVNLWRNHFGTWLIWDHAYTGNKPGTPSDDGYWKFCAPPGEYYVEVIMPPLGLVRARANIGAIEDNDSDITNANGPTTTDKFTVMSGQEKCDLGAGFYPQATAGNLVWIDANANGVQEAQEARMPGVMVEAVLLSNGKTTESAVTDTDGVYKIEGLEKQQYYLKFTPPAGYFATAPRAAADHMDSDVDGSYGPNTTRAFDMQPASAYENIDMGLSFAPLPVEWLDVMAKRVSNTHLIEWTVARESNVSHYEVERRFGSEKAFYTIPGKVLAKGNTHEVTAYNLSDLDVDKAGIYVYRVKQYDFDGKSTYSKLVKVSHNGENSIELYPNPARNETNIQIVVTQDAAVSVEMYDAASKLVKVIKKSDVQVAGDMIYNTNLQDVPAGVYNVVIMIDGVQTHKKLIRIE